LKFLNLEQNGLESWDEVVGFRQLPVLKRLTLSKNRIPHIYHKPGFNELYMLTIEDNLISKWESIDQLNAFKKISVLRCGGNPVTE
jgi:Leucine-rich repeat (LRR) protein